MTAFYTRSQIGQLSGLTTADVRSRDDAGDIRPAFKAARKLGKGKPREEDRPRFRARTAFALLVGKMFAGAGLAFPSTRKIIRFLDHECPDLEGRFARGDTHIHGNNRHVFFGRADSTFLGGPGAVLLALDVSDLWRQFKIQLDGQMQGREGAPTPAQATRPRPELLRAIELTAGVAKRGCSNG